MTWAAEEFAGAQLGDARLNHRLIKLTERFADKPTASIPGACPDWSETQGAYRFFDQANNAKRPLKWETVLAPHIERTAARMRQHRVVLCLQDTTELDFNGQSIEGLGPLSYEAQRGMYLHPTYAVTPEREPLGITDARMWARTPKADDGTRAGVRESLRWSEAYERIGEMAQTLTDTRLVCVGDREADIVEMMRRARDLGHPADWLIRSKHNRTLPEGSKSWAQTIVATPSGEIEFTLAARTAEAARVVRQQIWARALNIPDGAGGQLTVTCVVAKETNPPAGCKAVQWHLLTNRMASDFAEVVEWIDWYRCRWEIETFFNVLKNGCRVEALQLGSVAKLELALAVYMVVAWRLARLVRLGRTHPDLSASALLTEAEWKGAYILAKKKPPTQPPTIREVIRQIAMLGGFLGRKCDGQPGVKSLWLGFARVRDFVQGVEHMRLLQDAGGSCV
ncbi:IS4 family transposase [Verminephrobacter eiseniae]|uniref:IS4 family transposase n=2 Tax=Verminephrobacter eiseniae TaxID=364317 RepID=UPI00223781D8|nr:IS4 family transposase [Verminephrobacter eiseniae]MCW5263381.1 IS4 family transposase [Verminephrobacter eiseniae]